MKLILFCQKKKNINVHEYYIINNYSIILSLNIKNGNLSDSTYTLSICFMVILVLIFSRV